MSDHIVIFRPSRRTAERSDLTPHEAAEASFLRLCDKSALVSGLEKF